MLKLQSAHIVPVSRSVYVLPITSQWPHNCDASTWNIISNSLDTDFVYCDIHGRPFKKINIVGDVGLARQGEQEWLARM